MEIPFMTMREMKAEGFPGQSCSSIDNFDGKEKIYER